MTRFNFFFLIAAAIFLITGVPSRTVEETAQVVIEALAHLSFDEWSPAFLSTNSPLLGAVLPCTLFIPTSSTSRYTGGDDRRVSACHIVPVKLDFADLLSKKDGSLLPTLLDGTFIRVSNSSAGFSLDGVQVIEPNLYVDDVVALHRVSAPFHGEDHTSSLGWRGWSIIITFVTISCSATAWWLNRKHMILRHL